jgi:S-adenosylmethionine hydrolase
MPRGPRLITLLTDFGLEDPFVGVMKGVIAGLAPQARVIDVCHGVAPFAIRQARFLLGQSWPYFPKGSIHVVVVDPGVGGARRALLVEARGHAFIGPDNGVFGDVLALNGARTREIENETLRLENVSATFHGRDVFAPAAAHLAAGVAPARFGRLVRDAVRGEPAAPQPAGEREWTGVVEHVDRFGNLMTNFSAAEFAPGLAGGFCLCVGGAEVARMVDTYASAPPEEPVVVASSAGTLEIALREDSAARRLGVGPGAAVRLKLRQ